jgi:hypothetical protein
MDTMVSHFHPTLLVGGYHFELKWLRLASFVFSTQDLRRLFVTQHLVRAVRASVREDQFQFLASFLYLQIVRLRLLACVHSTGVEFRAQDRILD